MTAPLLCLLLCATPALAAQTQNPPTPTFSFVADETTVAPGSTALFTTFGSMIVDEQGRAVFLGYDSGGGSGVYSFHNGVLDVIADENTNIPGTSDQFNIFFDIGLDDGIVTFTAGFPGPNTGCAFIGSEGVFARPFSGGSITTVVDSPSFGNSCFHGVEYRDGLLSVAGGTNAPDLIHNHSESVYITASIGTLNTVLDTATTNPSGGTFFGYDQAIVMEGRNLYFAEIINNTFGAVAGAYVDRNDGLGPQVLVDATTPIPNGTGNFANIAGFDIDAGRIAFPGRDSTNHSWLYSGTGATTLQEMVGPSTQVPGETVNFLGVSNPVAYSNDVILFSGYWGGGGNGLFANHNATNYAILKKGDILNGLTVEQAFCWPQGLSGHFAMLDVRFPGFTRGLYLMEY